jgi:Fic family protein
MNDTTWLNKREKAIVKLLDNAGAPITRSTIEREIGKVYDASKVTILRDLKELIGRGLVIINDDGPATTYQSSSSSSLLRYIDADEYFSQDSDQRSITETPISEFLDTIADNDLLTQTEKVEYAEKNRYFQERLADISPTIYNRELERFTIELSWKSARIEGNTYSLLETEDLIKNHHASPEHTAEEAQMILNHKDALDAILRELPIYRKLNSYDVLSLHQILTKDLRVESGIRTGVVGITGTNYRPIDNQFQLKEAFDKMIDVVNAKENPLEKAIIASGMIAYLQPFMDGNKRTARLVGNAILLAHEYVAPSYRAVGEVEYKKAVLLIDEQQNFYEYKRIFLGQIDFALENYFR